jgi:hypothetical protein
MKSHRMLIAAVGLVVMTAPGVLAEECPPDEVWAEVDGSSVIVHHDNAELYCGAIRDNQITIDGFFITIVETDLPPFTMCLCCFDLEHEIQDLAPGTYTVEVWGAMGCQTTPCGTAVFTITAGTGAVALETVMSGCGGWQQLVFYDGFESSSCWGWDWYEPQ